MRYCRVLLLGFVCSILSPVIGSYDATYTPAHHDHDDFYEPSYPASPIVHPHHGHSAGSYYHYHVPLVGQQQHYQPSYHHQDHSHYLWPLLLLLALPLLFLPLLPLLLLPLGISLLALLMPGGMMMMMMMMMMGGDMMMRRGDTVSGRAFGEMRTFGDVILMDVTSLLTKYARSLDLDQCPQRVACEAGAIFFPENNSTDASSAKAFTNFLMEQYIPKGKVRKAIRHFEKAFWAGSKRDGSCSVFHCHPTFKIYNGKNSDGKVHEKGPNEVGSTQLHSIGSSSSFPSAQFNSSRVDVADSRIKKVNYVFPSTTVDVGDSSANNFLTNQDEESNKVKTKRSQYSHQSHHSYGKHKQEDVYTSPASLYNRKTTLYKMFGTPTVKS